MRTIVCGMVSILAIILITMFFQFVEELQYDSNSEEAFISPSGEQVVILKYDYASRPFLFHDDEMVFDYLKTGRNGFNESVDFEIDWISETEIRLYCEQYDESYTITLK